MIILSLLVVLIIVFIIVAPNLMANAEIDNMRSLDKEPHSFKSKLKTMDTDSLIEHCKLWEIDFKRLYASKESELNSYLSNGNISYRDLYGYHTSRMKYRECIIYYKYILHVNELTTRNTDIISINYKFDEHDKRIESIAEQLQSRN